MKPCTRCLTGSLFWDAEDELYTCHACGHIDRGRDWSPLPYAHEYPMGKTVTHHDGIWGKKDGGPVSLRMPSKRYYG